MLKVVYAGKRIGNLAPDPRPDQDVTAFRPRGPELVVLDQQPGELVFFLDQALVGGDVEAIEIGRDRGDTHGRGTYTEMPRLNPAFYRNIT